MSIPISEQVFDGNRRIDFLGFGKVVESRMGEVMLCGMIAYFL